MNDLNRILVFGAQGQLGCALVSQLGPHAAGLRRADVDVRDPKAVRDAIEKTGPDAIINAAAFTDVDGAESDHENAAAINVHAPGAMARAAAARGIPMVHVSTEYVFDGTGDVPWSPDDPPAPLNAYGQTKLAGEEAVMAAYPRASILRTSWVFSATGGNFVKTMLRLGETRTALDVVDDQIGGPTPAAALAAACVQLASGHHSGVYHYAGAPDVSWAGFARAIFDTAGLEVAIRSISTADYPARPAARPLNSRLDCRGFETATGLSRPLWRDHLPDIVAQIVSEGRL